MLRELEASHHQAERPLGCLPTGACHAVVEFRIFEGRQVEGKRLFEDHLVDPLTEECAQELLAGSQSPLRACQYGHQP